MRILYPMASNVPARRPVLTCIEWKGSPPSFNEIRSLAGRLYQEQGIDPQALLGHKDAATTAIYLDNRKVEWVSVG